MFRKIDDFIATWDYEVASTLKIFALLDEKKFHLKPHPQVRTASRLGWHITETISEMLNRTGLNVVEPNHDHDQFWAKAELIAAYEQAAKSARSEILNHWKDENLTDEVDMYGEKWTIAQVLSSLVFHQTHHRGQLTVVMRLSDLSVTGIYGPAKQEWALMGMPPMD